MTGGVGEFMRKSDAFSWYKFCPAAGAQRHVQVTLSTARTDMVVTRDVDLGPGRAHTGLAPRR